MWKCSESVWMEAVKTPVLETWAVTVEFVSPIVVCVCVCMCKVCACACRGWWLCACGNETCYPINLSFTSQ